MGAAERILNVWPAFVALGFFFGVALWWTRDLKPLGSMLLRERRYVRLVLITVMSAAGFLLFMAAATWLTF